MSKYSPYAIAQNEKPEWLPGEDRAAAAFWAIGLFIVIQLNFQIFHVFKRRRGLYFWAVEIGSWAVGLRCIVWIIMCYTPNIKHLWVLYTIPSLLCWSIYAVMQSLVLYSRLHLVSRSHKLSRGILIMIIVLMTCAIVPTWVTLYPAYSSNDELSALWSPRLAIVERYQQILIIIDESVICGVYIWKLSKLIKPNVRVRQRRVMIDLICVNALVIAFDIVTVVMTYLNQLGMEHAIQDFSYALKLQLEFVVLNQLMSVAAWGIRKERAMQKRYHHPGTHPSSLGPTATDAPLIQKPQPAMPVQSHPVRSNSDHTMVDPNTSPPSSPSTLRKQVSSTMPHSSQHEHGSNALNRMGLESGPRNSVDKERLAASLQGTRGADYRPGAGPTGDDRWERAAAAATSAEPPSPGESLDLPLPPITDEKPLCRKSVMQDTNTGTGDLYSDPYDVDDEEADEMRYGIHAWEKRGKPLLTAPWFSARR